MGSSYSNLTLRGADRERTIAALRARGRDAFVGPEQDGAFVVFDEASENDPEALEALAVELTRELGGVALAVTVHDEDVLYFSLVRDGSVLDQYDSCPGYFTGDEQPASGGDAAQLAETFGAPGSRDEVERILRAPPKQGDYFFETARHEDLVDVLGLPEYGVSLGYKYVYQGEADDLESEMTAVGAAASGDRDPNALVRDRLARDMPEAAAQLDALQAEMQHAAHGYFRALLAKDPDALRALFAGEPSIDDPATGRIQGEASLPEHVGKMHDALGTRARHYVPIALVQTPERTVATGRIALAEAGSVAMLPVASVWDRDANGGFTALRAYYSLGVLTGRRGERAPVLSPAEGLALPDVIATHLSALAADDVQALVGTYDQQCLAPLGLILMDPEDKVRGEYGAMLGQDGGITLQPCTVTATNEACAVEYVTTRWDGSEVPPQAGMALFELRDGRICQVHVFADLGPEPGASMAGGFGVEGLGGAMPDLRGLMSAFGGGLPGMPGGPSAAGLSGIDVEQMHQLMQGVQQMLNDTLSRPGGAASLLQGVGKLGGLGGLTGGADLGSLFGSLGAAGDEDEASELEWDFEQDEEEYREEEDKDEGPDDGKKT